MSTLQQNWRRGQNRLYLEARGVGVRGRGCEAEGEMAPTMYARMNKLIERKKGRKEGR
jgi:hypothetical protein